jgi:hypothetical protein
MPRHHHQSDDIPSVNIPKLFKLGTIDRYSPELTFDEIEIDASTPTFAIKILQELKETPFKLALLQQRYNPTDFKELIPYTKSFYGLNIAETYLNNNDLSSILPFGHLRYLDASENRFDDEGMSTITSFRELTELRLNSNKITHLSAQKLKLLEKLLILDVGCTYLGNVGIQAVSECKSVVTLNAEACGFDDSALRYFLSMPALRCLNITGNRQLTKAGIQQFLLKKHSDLVFKHDQ